MGKFLIGACAGGATVVLIILLWQLFPAIWALLTRESRIAGTYLIYDDTKHSVKVGEAEIKQHGIKASLKVDRNISRDGSYYDTPTTFFCDGYFRAGVLTALFFDADASYRPGAVVLRYDSGKACFVGLAVYCNSDHGIQPHHMELRRKQRTRTDL